MNPDLEHDALLESAYDRLGRPDLPTDVAALVADRLRTRRRRRRAALGVATAAAVAVTGVAVLATRSDDDVVAVDPPPEMEGARAESTLTATSASGFSYNFEDVNVTCDPSEVESKDEPDPGTGPAGTIWAYSPFETTPGGDGLELTYLYVELDLDRVGAGTTLAFPTDAPSIKTPSGSVFIAAAGDGNANEASSTEGDTSGTVRVLQASCGKEPVLQLDVDAVLGSEAGQDPIALRGTLR